MIARGGFTSAGAVNYWKMCPVVVFGTVIFLQLMENTNACHSLGRNRDCGKPPCDIPSVNGYGDIPAPLESYPSPSFPEFPDISSYGGGSLPDIQQPDIYPPVVDPYQSHKPLTGYGSGGSEFPGPGFPPDVIPPPEGNFVPPQVSPSGYGGQTHQTDRYRPDVGPGPRPRPDVFGPDEDYDPDGDYGPPRPRGQGPNGRFGPGRGRSGSDGDFGPGQRGRGPNGFGPGPSSRGPDGEFGPGPRGRGPDGFGPGPGGRGPDGGFGPDGRGPGPGGRGPDGGIGPDGRGPGPGSGGDFGPPPRGRGPGSGPGDYDGGEPDGGPPPPPPRGGGGRQDYDNDYDFDEPFATKQRKLALKKSEHRRAGDFRGFIQLDSKLNRVSNKNR